MYIGIDFGLKRIGLASGQLITKTATPIGIVNAINGKPDWPRFDAILEEYQAKELILGLPLNTDGTTSKISARVLEFKSTLTKRYKLPVHTINESLSSIEAQHRLENSNYKRHNKPPIDAVAAAIILEAWLANL